MNKKGFTLMELLVVIALIAIIVIIAIPSIISINKKINQRVYKTKVEQIIDSAELYGTNNPDIFNGRSEVKVYVYELINAGFLSTDKASDDDMCQNITSDEYKSDKGCVVDPVNKKSMNDNYVIIKKEAAGVTATFEGQTTTITNGTLVEQVCKRFMTGMFVGKYGTGETDYCGCIYDADNKPIKLAKLVKKNGKLEKVDGLYVASTDSGDRVNACIIAGDETNNYLKYGGSMWRVMGVYDVYGEDDGGRLVTKMITNDNVDVQ